ncbi:MAG: type II toxin-antitoxin system VapC family toxin [Acidobacteriota bacterium]
MLRLLDTDTCIHLLRETSVGAAERLKRAPAGEIGTTSITAAELRYGALKSARSRENTALVEVFLTPLRRVDLNDDAAIQFARLKHDLTRRGQAIGIMDMLIASIALAAQATLITGNTKEFSRVPGLRIEDWVRG